MVELLLLQINKFQVKSKTARRILYRILRKTGIEKEKIIPGASYHDDLMFDNTDWAVFSYYLENMFDITVNDDELNRMVFVRDTLRFVEGKI